MKNVPKYSWTMLIVMVLVLLASCKKKETTPDVIASFTFSVDASNFLKINFKNASANFSSLSWNFGDNSALSSETNPSHVYAAIGTYSVVLTATSTDGSTKNSYTASLTITDPNAELTKLAGTVSKTWKLLRQTSTGRYPLECGPEDHSTIWWAVGKDNDELANRPCQLNDEWTFYRNGGTMVFNAHGDFWREGGIFADPTGVCGDTSSMLGPNSEDLSAWGGGTHTYAMRVLPGGSTLTTLGKGAFAGFFKLGNGSETKVPLDSVHYKIIKLTEGPIDTLIIEGVYRWDPAQSGGYWRFVLMHYDNPNDEPPIPGKKPVAGFTQVISGLTVTFTNTSTGADSYSWNFGDGQTSTAASPVHTYAADGIYTIVLTATNTNGSTTATSVAFVSTTPLTDAILQGAAWKVRIDDYAVFVGSGLGKNDWWHVTKAMLESGTGTDNWTCMPTNTFTFSAGGHFVYATNGNARNDGYFGTPNGCWSDADIAASPGAAFGSCATHTYVFTPGTGTANPIITLTNGTGFAAFLGFYKGYNGVASGVKGGENTDNTLAPNFGSATNTYSVMGYANTGTKEYLFVSVDISAAHDGSSAWSTVLER
ncbi:MAG: PKD domain-containing protein [Bacteroidetes bacterium]|nr:PKD domain-containing protein [Bacteroidota bacterium]